MAEKMKPGKNGGNPKHNAGARKAVIQKWSEDRLAKEREIEKAIETYVKPLKDDLSRLNKNAKTDTGIPLKYLNALYKPFRLQEDAKAFMDEDEGREVQDHLRDAYEALAEGGQLDFVSVMDKANDDGEDEDQPSEAVLKKARAAGRAAAENNEDGTTNPYPEGDPCHEAWKSEWMKVQEERASKLGKEEDAA